LRPRVRAPACRSGPELPRRDAAGARLLRAVRASGPAGHSRQAAAAHPRRRARGRAAAAPPRIRACRAEAPALGDLARRAPAHARLARRCRGRAGGGVARVRLGMAARRRVRCPAAVRHGRPDALRSGGGLGRDGGRPARIAPRGGLTVRTHGRRCAGVTMHETTKRSRLYWASQIAGWSAYAVVAGTIPALFGSFEPAVALGALLAAAIGLLATHLLRRQILRKAWLALPLRRLAPRLLAAAASIAGVLTATVVLPVLPHLPAGVRAGAVAGDLIAHFTIVLGWSLIYSAAHYLRAVRAAEAEKWRLELAKRDAE